MKNLVYEYNFLFFERSRGEGSGAERRGDSALERPSDSQCLKRRHCARSVSSLSLSPSFCPFSITVQQERRNATHYKR